MRTSSRNFAVLLFDEVELWDVASVMQVASHAGRHWNWRPFRLLPTAKAVGLIETRSQLKVDAVFDLESCPAPELILVPGGYGARRAANDPRIVEWCATHAPRAELVLAIGAGVSVLGAAGVLASSEVAATLENVEWLRPLLPETRFDTSGGIVATSLAGTPDKLLTAASGAQGLSLGLRVVERCLGLKTATQLRDKLGLAAEVTRLELHDSPKIEGPPR